MKRKQTRRRGRERRAESHGNNSESPPRLTLASIYRFMVEKSTEARQAQERECSEAKERARSFPLLHERPRSATRGRRSKLSYYAPNSPASPTCTAPEDDIATMPLATHPVGMVSEASHTTSRHTSLDVPLILSSAVDAEQLRLTEPEVPLSSPARFPSGSDSDMDCPSISLSESSDCGVAESEDSTPPSPTF
jgi:hypothetical protein